MYGNKPKEIWIAENTYSYLRDLIDPGETVLDIGSGKGLVAELIKNNSACEVTCIDVIDINESGIPTTLYDGKTIPFPDRSFDVVICNFVLHHTTEHESLLGEMRRVSSSKMIILEDTPQNPIDRIFNLIHTFNSKRKYKSGKMKFRTDKNWQKLFADIGLTLVRTVPIGMDRDPLYPTHRTVYLLTT